MPLALALNLVEKWANGMRNSDCEGIAVLQCVSGVGGPTES